MTKNETCLFFAPYRSEKTRRPHPSKPGVCRATVSFPKLPNAYTPNLTPSPIYPNDCKGCPFFVSRKLDFPQPTKQQVLELIDTLRANGVTIRKKVNLERLLK